MKAFRTDPAGSYRPALLLIALAAVTLTLNGIWTPYSYWIDELFSVVASSETPSRLFWHWILVDVHPPLYQFLLQGWISLFGPGETATRSLSALAALATIALLTFTGWRRPRLAPLAILLLAMPYLYYNGQETRSYSMVYGLAVLLLLAQLEGRERLLRVTLVVLAWTHYFGLLLGLSLLFARLLTARRLLPGDVLAGLLMLAWLPLHLHFGLLGGSVAGFWIANAGVLETIRNFWGAFTPGLYEIMGHAVWLDWLLAAAVFALCAFFPLRRWRGHEVAVVDMTVTLAVAVFVVGIIVVDLQVPISTRRNFFVCVPLAGYLIFRVATVLLHGRWLPAFLMAWVVLQLAAGALLMQHRLEGIENFRLATSRLLLLEQAGFKAYFLDDCARKQTHQSRQIFNFYYRRFSPGAVQPTGICRDDLATLPAPAVVLSCHQGDKDVLAGWVPASFRIVPADRKGLCSNLIRRDG